MRLDSTGPERRRLCRGWGMVLTARQEAEDASRTTIRGPTMIEFTRERSAEGVTERLFDLTVAGERVPAVIWTPDGASGARPLILMGHGGSQHKKIGSLAARARIYARKFGYATLAIDAPGHGDRISREEAAKLSREVGARVTGQAGAAPRSAEMMKLMAERSKRAVPEWQAALDAVQTLSFVGKHEQIGYRSE